MIGGISMNGANAYGYYPQYFYPNISPSVPSGYQIQGTPSIPSYSMNMTPTPTTPPVSQSNASNIQWVQGESGALAFPVGPGQTVILLDSDDPVAYKKSADETGKPLHMEIYDLVKRVTTPTVPTFNSDEYVKKNDIKSMITELIEQEVEKRVSQMSFKPSSPRRKRLEEDEED